MPDLLKRLLLSIFPDLKAALLLSLDKENGGISGLEEACSLRAKGDTRLVLIYGFEDPARVRKQREGLLDETIGIHYVRLPADLDEIRKLVAKIARYADVDERGLDHSAVRKYAIGQVRAFKHICDNIWMSMSANANRAKKSMNNSPETIPGAILEFRSARLESLLGDFKGIQQMGIRLGIEGAVQGDEILQDVIEMIGQIESNRVSPQVAVDLAFRCVERLQDLSKILARAKELDQSG